MAGKKIGFIAIYQQPADKKKFDERYQKHLEVVEKQIGKAIESADVMKVEDKVFYQAAVVKFRPGTDGAAILDSAGMKAIVDDVNEFVPKGKAQVVPILKS